MRPQMGNKTISCLILLLLSTVLFLNTSRAGEREEETYSISLVQTAETGKDIVQVDEKKVLIENYTVRQGDHLWRLFRERGLLEKRDLPELISILKRLNKSLVNLDLIHPGERIVIPLTLAPIQGALVASRKVVETPATLPDLKDVILENYTVMPGDSLIKVVKGRFDIPNQGITRDYLELVRRLNPSIKDINVLLPGQTIRLPIYSPQVVRMPVKKALDSQSPTIEPGPAVERTELAELSRRLGEIFAQIGEDWTRTGQHFIPLRSGGQMNLKAEAFPILNLTNGTHVIVDLYQALPEKMVSLILSNWEQYRIVRMGKEEGVREALGKILPVCGYQKVFRPGEPLDLGGEIQIRVTADWIILAPAPPDRKGKAFAITLMDPASPGTPAQIKEYLKGLGVMILEYPSPEEPGRGALVAPPEPLPPEAETSDTVEALLSLTDRPFSSRAEIPLYQDQKADFNLIIKADFLMNIQGRESIIDLTGLGPEVLSLLSERRYRVLSLSGEKNPYTLVTKTLDFIGMKYSSKPHLFLVTERAPSKNITITVPGIVFDDQKGQKIFATGLKLPAEVAALISQQGYRIVALTPSR